MIYFFSVIAAVIFVECFLRFPIASLLKVFLKVARKSLWVVGAKSVSDHWKEKAMTVYSVRILILTFKISALIFCAILLALSPLAGYSFFLNGDFLFVETVSIDPVFIAISTCVGMAYSYMRVKYV